MPLGIILQKQTAMKLLTKSWAFIACAMSLFFNLSAVAKKPPHIILIMADDMGWECLGSYGSEDYKTPELDRLAAEGIKFNHCYSTPICTTSRVMLMTGKHNFRNYTHFGYLDPEEKTFGHLLKDAGYHTAVAGKWQLNGLYNKLEGFDDRKRPDKSGFDEWYLWQLTKSRGDSERYWNPLLEKNGRIISKKDNHGKFGPDLASEFLLDFFERKHRNGPVFLYYPMLLVHDPFVPTPDSDVEDKKKINAATKGAVAKKNFGDMVSYMDTIVGQIVKKVDELGELENTIIIFTADNGTHKSITSQWNGRKIKGGKGGMKDAGTHVPLIAYWKGAIPAGKISNEMIDFSDFYPTLADAAGVDISQEKNLDGESFYPVFKGENRSAPDWVFLGYQPYWAQQPGQYARTREFKLYHDGRFYQVSEDLDEKNNLAKTPEKSRSREANAALKQLEGVLKNAPPASQQKAGQNAKERPVYPDWPKLQ